MVPTVGTEYKSKEKALNGQCSGSRVCFDAYVKSMSSLFLHKVSYVFKSHFTFCV